jgi:hypothetical protein
VVWGVFVGAAAVGASVELNKENANVWNLFKRKQEPIVPYDYSSELRLEWSLDAEAWIASLTEFEAEASIYIASQNGTEHPLKSSCETVIAAKAKLSALRSQAIEFLAKNASEFVLTAYKHKLANESWRLTGIEVLEHEQTHDEFSLTLDPTFDEGAVWRVRFKDGVACDWSFDS